jgi:tetratricopeptide (TPR) repeat protein
MSSAMEALDLTKHDPEEYEGKLIVCNGREYLVGAYLGTGAERIVHKLINCKSKLCFHVIKVVRQPRPRGIYTKLIARLRSNSQLARVIPITVELEIAGGRVELQPYFPSPSEERDPVADLLDEADAHLKHNDYTQAIDIYNRVLRTNPSHTMALINLSAAYRGLNEISRSRELASMAVEIEPNYFQYRHALISYSAELGQIHYALEEFFRMKAIFQDTHDLDDLGARLLMASGKPEAAKSYVETAHIEGAERDSLRKQIKEAVAAKTRAEKLMALAKRRVDQRKWKDALDTLVDAHTLYDKSPILNVNLALALSRSGDLKRATSLLIGASAVLSEVWNPVCMANAAFCMIKDGELELAVTLLDTVSSVLSILHGGRLPANLADLPGIAIWLSEHSVIEEKIATASTLIDRALANLPEHASVPQNVIELAEAYRTVAKSQPSYE